MSQFQIVTVSTHVPNAWYYTYFHFLKSCGEYKPLILDRFYSRYSGLGSKPKALLRAINDGLITTPYILFCDSWDTFFAADPQVLFEKYFEFDSPIVISAEKNCFPDDLKPEYDELNPTAKYKYLNSGMIIGETEAIKQMMEAMELDKVPDDYWDKENSCMVHINDQFLFQQIFLKQPVKIALDYNQSLCQTLHDISSDEFEISDKGIRNKVTNTFPVLFHANGSAKDSGVKEPILNHLKIL